LDRTDLRFLWNFDEVKSAPTRIGDRSHSERRKNLGGGPRNGWVDGIDVSVKMVEEAKKRISKTGQQNYTLHLCDCRRLPFEDETFDVIMNQYLLDILPVEDFIPILLEFKRVLKDGGRVILANMTKGEKWLNQIYEGIYRLRPPLLAECRGVMAQPFLKQIGFREFHREFVSQLGFPSKVVRGVKKNGLSY
jgi:ubiquinone/menaquinone biosynthesis C-methylase UbiE